MEYLNKKEEETNKIIDQGFKKLLKHGGIIVPWKDDMEEAYEKIKKVYHDLIIKHPNWEEPDVQEQVFHGIVSKLKSQPDIKFRLCVDKGIIVTNDYNKIINIYNHCTSQKK